MKKVTLKLNIPLPVLTAVVTGLIVTGTIYATTTIGTNISADGTITAVGQLRASSTALFTDNITTYANSTFGNANTDVNLFTGTLQASTTALFTGPVSLYSTASTSIAGPIEHSSGDLILSGNGTGNDVLLNPYGGNVGIGTTSPSYKLEIDEGLIQVQKDQNPGIRFSRNGSSYTGINLGAGNDYLYFNFNGTSKLMITNSGQTQIGGTIGNPAAGVGLSVMSGNVGFGTTTPSKSFVVDSGASATTTIEIGDIYSGTGKTCFNVAQDDGSVASFYFSGGNMVVETNACR